jgi:hypothetical protein
VSAIPQPTAMRVARRRRSRPPTPLSLAATTLTSNEAHTFSTTGALSFWPCLLTRFRDNAERPGVFQSVPESVRGSPNRGITLAVKPVTAVMRSSAIVTTCSP